MDLQTLQKQIDNLTQKLGLLESSYTIPRDIETALRERLNIANITSGSGAPTTIPKKLGDVYVDTTNAKIYCATGLSTASDFKILN